MPPGAATRCRAVQCTVYFDDSVVWGCAVAASSKTVENLLFARCDIKFENCATSNVIEAAAQISATNGRAVERAVRVRQKAVRVQAVSATLKAMENPLAA